MPMVGHIAEDSGSPMEEMADPAQWKMVASTGVTQVTPTTSSRGISVAPVSLHQCKLCMQSILENVT